MDDIKLNSLKLGTQEYWNQFYKREISNFHENDADTGERWFDDSDAESKMIQYLIDKMNDAEIEFDDSVVNVVDLGTGNGHFLFQLKEEIAEEYEGDDQFQYVGVDYSPDSIQFCREIAANSGASDVKFEEVDLLQDDHPFLQNKFEVIIDKGTLDAIALNQEAKYDGKTGVEVYGTQVSKMMKPDSKLLITSCNFTSEELIKIITSGTGLKVWGQIPYPSFEFGGVKGATICSVIFEK